MRARVLLVLVGFSEAGCTAELPDVSPDPREEHRAPRSGAVDFDCGTLELPVRLECGAAVQETEEGLVLGTEATTSFSELPCDLSNSNPEPKRLGSEMTAWCDAAPSFLAADFTRGLHVRGVTSVGCPYKGVADAKQGLVWSASVDLPAGSHQIEVVSISNGDRLCELSVGGALGDPIRQAWSRQLLAYVEGPATVPVELRCEVLGRARCHAMPGEPLNDEVSLDVFIQVTETE
jgi:hypothetical protein